MSTAGCVFPDRDECAARYVAGTLAEASIESFELHLLACAACRSDVRDAAGLRAALRKPARRRAVVRWLPIGIAAAAGVAWLLITPGPLERLGRLNDPPQLTLMPVRGDPDSAALYSARGLAAYRAERYDEAARWLSRSHAEKSDAGAAFYAGAAFVVVSEPDSALRLLHPLTRGGHPGYAAEAHVLAAHAWLQKNRADSALVHLQEAERIGHAPVRAAAAKLRARVESER
jgi:hypothetical protein